MITVNTPDGGIAQFPDGTPKDVITNALRKKFGKPADVSTVFTDALANPPRNYGPTMADAPEEVQARLNAESHFRANPNGRLSAAADSLWNGLTYGYGDNVMAGIRALSPNTTYDQALGYERGRLAAGRENYPGTAIISEIAGAVLSPVNKALAPAKAANMAGAVTNSALSGLLAGALWGGGASDGKDVLGNVASNAAIGGGIGVALPAVGGLIQSGMNARATKKAISDLVAKAPSTDELRAAGRAAYGAIDQAGVSIKPSAIQQGLGGISSHLKAEGAGLDAGGRIFPAARAIMDVSDDAAQKATSTPFSEVDILRRFMGHAAGANPANKADTRLATTAMSKLDEMVMGLKDVDVDAGDLQALQTLLPKARDLWTRMSRSQMIDDAIEAGDNYLSGPASGIRNQFARILRNPKLSRGFSDVEKSVMRRVASGSLAERVVHLAGGGIGKIASVAGGFGGGGIPGAAAGGAISMGLNKLSESIVRRNAEAARALIASGGMKAPAQASPATANAIEEILRRALRPITPSLAQPLTGSPVPR